MLPELIEIVPLEKPVRAEITVPGSKSITNRALILAALAEGEVTLKGALWSEDTQIMVECLQELGFMVDVRPDPEEFCNRIITVYGHGGAVPPGGSEAQPMELFVGNAGTAARFLAAFVCLGKGIYRLHGVPRMHERPQAALFHALRQLGYRVEAENANETLPARIIADCGLRIAESGARRRECTVSIVDSSQFASALLLCAHRGGWQVKITGENAEESPYVAMTSKMIGIFPHRGGRFQIEPDASSGSYFLAAGKIIRSPEYLEFSPQFGVEVATQLFSHVQVREWPHSDWQIDEHFSEFLLFGAGMRCVRDLHLRPGEIPGPDVAVRFQEAEGRAEISRRFDLGDSIMTAVVMAPLGKKQVHFADLGRLRVQETERVAALRTELTRCGAKVVEAGDTLTVSPSPLHGAEIETYNDHRMAMCFAILGLKIPGIKIKNPACVKKTFPNFFQKLAASPPQGLGATIRDAKTRRNLSHDELFAE